MLDADFFLLLLSRKKEEQLDPSPQSRGMCPSPEFIGSRKVAHSCVSELYSHFYPQAGPDLVRVIPF